MRRAAKAATETRVSVQRVRLDATPLETFDLRGSVLEPKGVRGAICRVRRAPDTTDTIVTDFCQMLVREGALMVSVERCARHAVVVEEKIPAKPVVGIREVVMGMVAEANTSNRAALASAVEAALAAAGL